MMTRGFRLEDVEGYIGSHDLVNHILDKQPHLRPYHAINPWCIHLIAVETIGNVHRTRYDEIVEALDSSGRAYAYGNRLFNLTRTHGYKEALLKINHSGWSYYDWYLRNGIQI